MKTQILFLRKSKYYMRGKKLFISEKYIPQVYGMTWGLN